MRLETKLPKVGTTIFTVMSQLAAEHGAVNLGQGFPDFSVPERLVDELDARHARRPQPVRADDRRAGAAPGDRRQDRALSTAARPDADAEITVTSGATEAIFNAIHAVVRAGDEVIVLDPCLRLLRTGHRPGRRARGARAAGSARRSRRTGSRCATRSRRGRAC